MSRPQVGSETHRALVGLAISAAYADCGEIERAVAVVMDHWDLPSAVPPVDEDAYSAAIRRAEERVAVAEREVEFNAVLLRKLRGGGDCA